MQQIYLIYSIYYIMCSQTNSKSVHEALLNTLEKNRKEASTLGSQRIPEASTNTASPCLDSEVGRDLSFTWQYGRLQ